MTTISTSNTLNCQDCGAKILQIKRFNDIGRTIIVYCSKCKMENIYTSMSSRISNAAIVMLKKNGVIGK